MLAMPAALEAQTIPGALPESAKALCPMRFVPGLNMPVRDLFNRDPHLWVYDKTTGEMLAEIVLPANTTSAPITYMAGGKQFIVFSVGGAKLTEELIAMSL